MMHTLVLAECYSYKYTTKKYLISYLAILFHCSLVEDTGIHVLSSPL